MEGRQRPDQAEGEDAEAEGPGDAPPAEDAGLGDDAARGHA